MKKSNKVILTAVFFSAISSASSKAQTVQDTSGTAKNNNDSLVSYNDSTAYYNDSSSYNKQAQENYIYPSNVGFWGRIQIFFHFGYYGNYWRNQQYAMAGTQNNTSYGPQHSGLRTVTPGPRPTTAPGPRQTVATAPASQQPRKEGFGNTMRKNSSTASS